MTIATSESRIKHPDESRIGAVSLNGFLDDAELLVGTPVLSCRPTGLTFSNATINTTPLEINGVSVPAGKAIRFLVSGGTTGTRYRCEARVSTNSTPPQALVVEFQLMALGVTTPPFKPADLGGLLAEYDFLAGASRAILYDRKPGGGADGTVGIGASYSSYGLTTNVSGGGLQTAFATTGVPSNAAKTILLFLKPISGTDILSSAAGPGTLSPLYVDMPIDNAAIAKGVVYPRLRDVPNTLFTSARQFPMSWPFSWGWTLTDPVTQYTNGVAAALYDLSANGFDYNVGTSPIGLGNNFVSNSTSQTLYCYALFFSTVLTPAEVLQCHNYMAKQVALRSVPAGGPITLSTDLLVLTGNSYVNLMDINQITPIHNFDKVLNGFGGQGPSQVVAIARQSTQQLKRPLATRNYHVIWPTPNNPVVGDIDTYFVPYVREMQSQGWKVVGLSAISATGYDTIKNGVNARYDILQAGPTPLFDAFVDLRNHPEISADGAYATGAYLDGVHLTPASYASYVYPQLIAAINSLG